MTMTILDRIFNSKSGCMTRACAATKHKCLPYFIKHSAHFCCIEIDAETFPAHYTWKVAAKGFKMAFMMNKDAMIILILLKKYINLKLKTRPKLLLGPLSLYHRAPRDRNHEHT
jgi:hypothetical protein